MKANQTIRTTLTASLLLCVSTIPNASAATIPIDATLIGGAGCDIVEALANASLVSGGNAGNDCVAGDAGGNIIDLQGNLLTFTTGPYDADYGLTALPPITSTVTISNGVLARDTNASEYFRLLHVTDEGALTLSGVTVQGGTLYEGDGFCRLLLGSG